jgi:hypothetical protein
MHLTDHVQRAKFSLNQGLTQVRQALYYWLHPPAPWMFVLEREIFVEGPGGTCLKPSNFEAKAGWWIQVSLGYTVKPCLKKRVWESSLISCEPRITLSLLHPTQHSSPAEAADRLMWLFDYTHHDSSHGVWRSPGARTVSLVRDYLQPRVQKSDAPRMFVETE